MVGDIIVVRLVRGQRMVRSIWVVWNIKLVRLVGGIELVRVVGS